MRTNAFVTASPSAVSRFALTSFAAAALACAAFSLPAMAQTAAPTTPVEASTTAQHQRGHHTGEHAAKHQQRHEQRHQKRAERRAQHLAQLHQKLALSPAQEQAWTGFEQAMQASAAPTARLDRQAMAQLTTPERIDRMRALQAQRSAAMDARGDATKAFYAQLQPAQQQVFDDSHKMGMRHGHRMGKRHGGEHAAQRPANAG